MQVAETLDEFRGNQRYNFLDEPFRRFNAEVPMLAQWDDHEVRNNWFPTEILDDDRYTEKRMAVLSARAATLRTAGAGRAVVLGQGQSLDASSAAFLNVMASSVDAFDDTDAVMMLHPYRRR